VPTDASPAEGTCARWNPIPKGWADRDDVPRIDSVRRVEEREEVTPVYIEIPVGRGAVGVLTMNIEGLAVTPANVAFLQDLWRPIVRWRIEAGRSDLQARWTRSHSSELASKLRDESRDIGIPFLVALIVFYLVLVGPVLYFLLKRKNRLLDLIWAEPLLALVYVGVVFATGYLTKGVLTKTQLWTLIKQVEGEDLGARESYLAIFSGDEADYTIRAPHGDFLISVAANAKEARQAKTVVVSEARGGHALEDYRLELWQQGYAVNGEFVEFSGDGIELSQHENDEGEAMVRFKNNLPFPVVSAMIPEGPLFLPPLAPGAEVELPARSLLSETGLGRASRLQSEELREKIESLLRQSYGLQGEPRLIALLQRDVNDFEIDLPSTVKERFD
jgi:hypothetical protein